MEGNGQGSTGSERLDRIERALELLVDDHILFREEHKQLLTAQVLMSGKLEKISDELDRFGVQVEKLGVHVQKVTEDVDKLSREVSLMRQNFDDRLKRLEA